ncbi:acylphosphatase [Paraburkholderia atlantica]|uniref:acylphosphatase n=1 Tax=Paraburkholderia atlantica TaxID=2654982 RepID=A0A6I1PYA9_PARAM|nr:acylphosphatase [Paraburkholderia atlantica]MBB5414550.1 acylphosphatase [Paraburkholderia atlantica]MBB5427178.1 acylphosphatase [Paraburkholderia atlantica]MPW07959.1 acylphosphatase [Paraburkholderia atlantica]
MTPQFDTDLRTRLVRVYGRVQGVGYRQACIDEATARAITGWVRNRMDGSVEAVLQGRAEELERICDWLVDGAHGALVDRLEIKELSPPVARFDQFKLAATV